MLKLLIKAVEGEKKQGRISIKNNFSFTLPLVKPCQHLIQGETWCSVGVQELSPKPHEH